MFKSELHTHVTTQNIPGIFRITYAYEVKFFLSQQMIYYIIIYLNDILIKEVENAKTLYLNEG